MKTEWTEASFQRKQFMEANKDWIKSVTDFIKDENKIVVTITTPRGITTFYQFFDMNFFNTNQP